MNINDKIVKDAYGEVINRGKGLFLVKKTSKNDGVIPFTNGFRLRISTNKRLYIIESYFVDFKVKSPVLISHDGTILESECSVKQLRYLSDLNGVNDGTIDMRVTGNNLYTSKPVFIGVKGSNVKLLAKYLGKVNVIVTKSK